MQRQIVLTAFIVVTVFDVPVVQVALTQHDGLHMYRGIMPVHPAYGIGFLLYFGKVTEHVFGIFSLNTQIQFHAVKTSQSEQSQFIVTVETSFQFEGSISIRRQERQSQHLEQSLQVGLADRHQIGGLFAQVPVGTQRNFRSAQSGFQGVPLHVAIAQTEIQHTAQGIAPVGREGPAVKLHTTNQVGINQSDRPAGSSLGTEMVDVRNFHSIQIETVFRRPTASHNQIVTVTDGRKSHSRIILHHL